MADSDAHTGYGAFIQKGDGASPENFVSIMGVKSISGPSIQRDTHDTTDMSSGVGRQFIGGLVDFGEVSFEANFLPRNETQSNGDDSFLAEFEKSSCESRGNWRILLPACEGEGEAYFQFAGIATGATFSIPMDDVMGFTGTLKVSGAAELTVET